jgi:hypothetical protein
MIHVKRKRTISILNPKLIKIRDSLREIISQASDAYERELIQEKANLSIETDEEKVRILADKIDKIYTAWKNSICVCPVCGSRTSDMTFNLYLKAWFCVDCYEKNRDFYVRRGEPHIYP